MCGIWDVPMTYAGMLNAESWPVITNGYTAYGGHDWLAFSIQHVSICLWVTFIGREGSSLLYGVDHVP